MEQHTSPIGYETGRRGVDYMLGNEVRTSRILFYFEIIELSIFSKDEEFIL